MADTDDERNDLLDQLFELCQNFGFCTDHTYELLESAVDSIIETEE